jgi:hypothetical protein
MLPKQKIHNFSKVRCHKLQQTTKLHIASVAITPHVGASPMTLISTTMERPPVTKLLY